MFRCGVLVSSLRDAARAGLRRLRCVRLALLCRRQEPSIQSIFDPAPMISGVEKVCRDDFFANRRPVGSDDGHSGGVLPDTDPPGIARRLNEGWARLARSLRSPLQEACSVPVY